MNRHRSPRPCAVCACLFLSGVASAQDATTLDWPDVVAGVRFERERLRSGIYTASGTESHWGAEGPSPATLYSAFSFDEGRIRFEHRGRGPVRRGGRTVVEDTHRIVCVLPDATQHFTSLPSSLMLNIVPPGTFYVKGRDGTRGYLDPRELGMIAMDDVYSGLAFEDVAEKWATAVTAKTPEIFPEGDGVIRASLVDAGRRDSYWIDTKHGFTIARYRNEAGMKSDATGEFLRLSEAIAQNEALQARLRERDIDWMARRDLDVPDDVDIGWTEIDGIWVPSSYKHVTLRQQGGPGEKTRIVRQELTLSFDWSAVNSPLDDKLFDYHYFELPTGTEVFDQRTADAVFVERIGPPPVVARSAPFGDRRGPNWVLLLAINAVAIGALIIVLALRRRGRGRYN